MYAQRIKLKAHNYPSQRSEDSDPVTAEDKRGSRTMKEATVSPLTGWSGCDSQTDGLKGGSIFSTPKLLMDRFTATEFQHFYLSFRTSS